MQINPIRETFTEPIDLGDEGTEEFQTKLEKMMEDGDIVAIGSEEHLQILKLDLIKAGYLIQEQGD